MIKQLDSIDGLFPKNYYTTRELREKDFLDSMEMVFGGNLRRLGWSIGEQECSISRGIISGGVEHLIEIVTGKCFYEVTVYEINGTDQQVVQSNIDFNFYACYYSVMGVYSLKLSKRKE